MGAQLRNKPTTSSFPRSASGSTSTNKANATPAKGQVDDETLALIVSMTDDSQTLLQKSPPPKNSGNTLSTEHDTKINESLNSNIVTKILSQIYDSPAPSPRRSFRTQNAMIGKQTTMAHLFKGIDNIMNSN